MKNIVQNNKTSFETETAQNFLKMWIKSPIYMQLFFKSPYTVKSWKWLILGPVIYKNRHFKVTIKTVICGHLHHLQGMKTLNPSYSGYRLRFYGRF